MTPEELEALTKPQIIQALAEASVEMPPDVEELLKSGLVEFATPYLVTDESDPESTPESAPEVEEEEEVEPDPIPDEDVDVYSRLVKAGFEDKVDVKNHLNAVDREKKNHKSRMDLLENREKELDTRETALMRRERDVDNTATKLQEKLMAAKKETAYYTKLKEELSNNNNG
jgi:predicted transcriptional regulator